MLKIAYSHCERSEAIFSAYSYYLINEKGLIRRFQLLAMTRNEFDHDHNTNAL